MINSTLPDKDGHFGEYGGRFVPETLMGALEELDKEYNAIKNNSDFQRKLTHLNSSFAGRPTPLYFAENLTKKLGGAKIYLKREDLAHTPSISKIANDRITSDDEDETFLKLVKDITSKGFVRSNYKEKLVDLSNVRINLKSKK